MHAKFLYWPLTHYWVCTDYLTSCWSVEFWPKGRSTVPSDLPARKIGTMTTDVDRDHWHSGNCPNYGPDDVSWNKQRMTSINVQQSNRTITNNPKMTLTRAVHVKDRRKPRAIRHKKGEYQKQHRTGKCTDRMNRQGHCSGECFHWFNLTLSGIIALLERSLYRFTEICRRLCNFDNSKDHIYLRFSHRRPSNPGWQVHR